MATLLSEDEEVVSGIEFQVLGQAPGRDAGWWTYRLTAWAGERRLVLEPLPGAADERCCVTLDEVGLLRRVVGALLDGRRSRVVFEPAEPCFELQLEQHELGLRVAVWIDAGNQASPHYTWDAAGVRFFTTEARLRAFLADLSKS